MTNEQLIEIRKLLFQKAKRCFMVLEMSAYEFEENCKDEVPEMIEAIGQKNFDHLISYVWRVG